MKRRSKSVNEVWRRRQPRLFLSRRQMLRYSFLRRRPVHPSPFLLSLQTPILHPASIFRFPAPLPHPAPIHLAHLHHRLLHSHRLSPTSILTFPLLRRRRRRRRLARRRRSGSQLPTKKIRLPFLRLPSVLRLLVSSWAERRGKGGNTFWLEG